MSYAREIKTPANRKEGLCNFVQIIINRLEAGDDREALLTAVDLLDDLSGSVYDDVAVDVSPDMMPMGEHFAAMSSAKGAAYGDGFAAGQKAKADELRKVFDPA